MTGNSVAGGSRGMWVLWEPAISSWVNSALSTAAILKRTERARVRNAACSWRLMLCILLLGIVSTYGDVGAAEHDYWMGSHGVLMTGLTALDEPGVIVTAEVVKNADVVSADAKRQFTRMTLRVLEYHEGAGPDMIDVFVPARIALDDEVAEHKSIPNGYSVIPTETRVLMAAVRFAFRDDPNWDSTIRALWHPKGWSFLVLEDCDDVEGGACASRIIGLEIVQGHGRPVITDPQVVTGKPIVEAPRAIAEVLEDLRKSRQERANEWERALRVVNGATD